MCLIVEANLIHNFSNPRLALPVAQITNYVQRLGNNPTDLHPWRKGRVGILKDSLDIPPILGSELSRNLSRDDLTLKANLAFSW
jgi:hypothetical protein